MPDDLLEKRSGHTQSVSRALSLLIKLAEEPEGLNLSELARRVKLAPSTAHRLLTTLQLDQFGRVYGFHKRFCLWTRLGRGSPEDPGLVLALDRGGSVRGFVFRIASKHAAQEMDILWQREMINNSYNPKWVSVHTNCGVKKALSFVIRRDSPSYAYRMSDENIAEIISRAAGFLGPCCDYLFETAKALKENLVREFNILFFNLLCLIFNFVFII